MAITTVKNAKKPSNFQRQKIKNNNLKKKTPNFFVSGGLFFGKFVGRFGRSKRGRGGTVLQDSQFAVLKERDKY